MHLFPPNQFGGNKNKPNAKAEQIRFKMVTFVSI